MIGRALVSRDRALRLNPAFVSFQFPSVLLIYRLVRFSTNSASDHSRLLTPASIAGRARKVWNGATLPSAPVSAKDRNPPDLVVREGDHGCRLRGNPPHSPIAGRIGRSAPIPDLPTLAPEKGRFHRSSCCSRPGKTRSSEHHQPLRSGTMVSLDLGTHQCVPPP